MNNNSGSKQKAKSFTFDISPEVQGFIDAMGWVAMCGFAMMAFRWSDTPPVKQGVAGLWEKIGPCLGHFIAYTIFARVYGIRTPVTGAAYVSCLALLISSCLGASFERSATIAEMAFIPSLVIIPLIKHRLGSSGTLEKDAIPPENSRSDLKKDAL